MTTLGFERGSSATTSHRRFEKELEVIIDKARENGKIDDPTVRQGLAKQWSKIQIMRINGYRTLTATVQNKKDLGVAALGATNKMFWSETHRDTLNLAMDILGPYAQILTGHVTDEEEFVPGYGRRHGRADYPCRSCRPRSSSRGPRRSGAAPPRSSATSSASESLDFPKNPSRA